MVSSTRLIKKQRDKKVIMSSKTHSQLAYLPSFIMADADHIVSN